MDTKTSVFPLAPVYRHQGIGHVQQAHGVAIRREADLADMGRAVEAQGRRAPDARRQHGSGNLQVRRRAFECAFNVDQKLREAGVRDRVRLVHAIKEANLGDSVSAGLTFEETGTPSSATQRPAGQWSSSLVRSTSVAAGQS